MTGLLRYKTRRETRWIILHDSHTVPSRVKWSEEMANEGGLRMGLLSTGFHDIILQDGSLIECRPHALIGSHTPGHNMDSLGICLEGGRELDGRPVDNFTDAQRRTLLKRCHEYKTSLYPTIEGVRGHSEIQRYRRRDMPHCPALDMDLFRASLDYMPYGVTLT